MTRLAALAFVCAAAIAITAPARADEATAKQFLQLDASEDGVSLAELKISSLEEGIRVTNMSLASNARLYCQPSALVMTGTQLADMVRRAVKQDDKLEDKALSSVLLDVLEKTFPCAAPAH